MSLKNETKNHNIFVTQTPLQFKETMTFRLKLAISINNNQINKCNPRAKAWKYYSEYRGLPPFEYNLSLVSECTCVISRYLSKSIFNIPPIESFSFINHNLLNGFLF